MIRFEKTNNNIKSHFPSAAADFLQRIASLIKFGTKCDFIGALREEIVMNETLRFA
jgi:hypothetical protein